MLSRFLHRKTGFPLAFKSRSVARCSRQILPLVFSSQSTPDPWLTVPDTDSSADFFSHSKRDLWLAGLVIKQIRGRVFLQIWEWVKSFACDRSWHGVDTLSHHC
jgi:hypothetical protein